MTDTLGNTHQSGTTTRIVVLGGGGDDAKPVDRSDVK